MGPTNQPQMSDCQAVTVRFSVGIEGAQDIIADITRALDKI
jgi:cystathionine beta-lyase/cystathionine gamma-synthase